MHLTRKCKGYWLANDYLRIFILYHLCGPYNYKQPRTKAATTNMHAIQKFRVHAKVFTTTSKSTTIDMHCLKMAQGNITRQGNTQYCK